MYEKIFVPSIEQRLAGLIEVSRRARLEAESSDRKHMKLTVTISREFGCEAYPVAEKLKILLEEKTGEPWAIVDKSLIDEVAKHNDLTADILHNLGQRPRWLDDMLSTLSPRWHNEKDHFQLLAQQIVAIAASGNAIIIGMGGAIVSQSLKNCFHFRLFGSHEFKTASIARRAKISHQEAELLIEKHQKAREKFIRDFLNQDINNPHFHHLLFNNDRNSADRIAHTIAGFFPE